MSEASAVKYCCYGRCIELYQPILWKWRKGARTLHIRNLILVRQMHSP